MLQTVVSDNYVSMGDAYTPVGAEAELLGAVVTFGCFLFANMRVSGVLEDAVVYTNLCVGDKQLCDYHLRGLLRDIQSV